MSPSEDNSKSADLTIRLLAVGAALCCFFLAVSAHAQAAGALELTGHFAGSATPVLEEKFSEEVQLGGVGGMAVNVSGAGGVTPGTVYAATRNLAGFVRVATFVPKGEGLMFNLGWQVPFAKGEAYERCGPALGLDGGGKAIAPCSVQANETPGRVDVDVDQVTGNVYVYTGTLAAGNLAVAVYTPDGSAELTRFGKLAAAGKKVAETPAEIHTSDYPGQIAVNDTGEVYVFDVNEGFDNFYHRLMVFKPETPGDYEHYVYAGEAAAGFLGEVEYPAAPVSDAAGNVYVGGGQGGDLIQMYSPPTPAPYPSGSATPVCEYKFIPGGITAVTVDRSSGEVFFFSYKKPKLIHRLSPCSGGAGFKESVETLEVKPERDDIWGLAFDPGRKLSALREPGVLYAGAPSPVPSSAVGKGEKGQSSLGYIYASPIEAEAEIEAESVGRVGTTTARLSAQIDPKGFQTHYAFEYLSEAAYIEAGETFAGAGEAPLGGAQLEGAASQTVGVSLSGLNADTRYRFRVVASSNCKPGEPEVICDVEGEAKSFRTFPPGTAGLADNRAWELVSPAEKNGGQVLPADPRLSSCGECKPGLLYEHFPMQSAPDGNALVYEGLPFSTGEGAGVENEYLARRDPSTGWGNTSLTPALLLSKGGGGYKGFSTDLSQGVLVQRNPPLKAAVPPGYQSLYSQPTNEPAKLTPSLLEAPPHRSADGINAFNLNYTGASEDLSKIFLSANDTLTVETPVAPAPLDGGASKDNLYEWEPASGVLRLVNVAPGNASRAAGASFAPGSAHPISADGSRAFWSDEAGQVFVREGAEVTREIPDPGKFLAAATDGSRVLLDNGHLYDLETEATTDLTGGAGGFAGVVGQSDDLTVAYFVDTAVLSGEEENDQGDKAQAGQDNLYAWNEGALAFVATLVAGDNINGSGDLSRTWASAPAARTAEASPAGRFVAFMSQVPLTGYDNTGPCESDHAGGVADAPCPETFLYDSVSGSLTCASCNRSEATPLGPSTLRLIRGPFDLPQPRYLSDAGRLFFDSQDSLLPADSNEGAEDVYEFEPQGTGSCNRAEGCLSLISGGREATDSNFLAADPSGKNAFFTTRDRLVRADTDSLIDAYDARVDGGFAEPAAPTIEELPLQVPPLEPIPASPTFTGPGNVKPTKAKHCKKNQVKKHGNCTKKHQKKSKRHKRARRHKMASPK